MARGRKQISFDLDTKRLMDYYPTENWRNAYEDIKRHMQKNGFVWQQGSVYVSRGPITYAFVAKILKALTQKHPWINVCMRDCAVASIERFYSQNHLFDKNANIPMRNKNREPFSSMSDYKAQIAEMRKKDEKNQSHQEEKRRTSRLDRRER